MTSRTVLIAELRAAGCVFAEDEADILLGEDLVPSELTELIRRRVAGEPLEYLVGWAEFGGQRIAIDAGVFVPRRRTELMATVAIDRLAGRESPVLLDLCCGSGAVAAMISAAIEDVQIFATDCDPVAVRCARRNLPAGQVFEGDLYRALPPSLAGQVAALVANAPYVPRDSIALMPPEARLFEAGIALDGGSDGLDVLRPVIAGAPDWLAPDGVVLVEAARSQLGPLVDHAGDCGLSTIVHEDEELSALVLELVRR